jgi:hypothetical protein
MAQNPWSLPDSNHSTHHLGCDNVYYLHSNSPLTTAAEILKTEYRAQKVIKFNLPISGNSDLEYLGVVLKDKVGQSLDTAS